MFAEGDDHFVWGKACVHDLGVLGVAVTGVGFGEGGDVNLVELMGDFGGGERGVAAGE